MSRYFRRVHTALALAFLVAPGCDTLRDALPDVTLGAGQGIPAIAGSTAVTLPTGYTCGSPITDPSGKYTVTSTGTQDACTVTFAQSVVVLSAADYANHPELQGAQLIQSVVFDVTALAVTDGATGSPIDPTTTLRDLSGTAFGAVLLTKDDLARPKPFRRTIEGASLDALKSQVRAKQDLIIPLVVTVELALTPTPPAQIGLTFDAQPSLVFGF